jgi:hypothetical protein
MLSNTSATNLTPISPSTAFNLPAQNLAPAPPQQSPTVSLAVAKKRKLTDADEHTALSLEDRTRFAAEEDKRRRNTAASARFRVKKKLREQALEKTSKEMSDRASALEKRLQELETENRWLKGLITEKDGEGSIRERYAKFIAEGGDKTLNRSSGESSSDS